MQLTIEIDDSQLLELIHKAANDAISGIGLQATFYQKVKQLVANQLAETEFAEMIDKVVAQRLDGMVADAVLNEFRREIAEKTRKMRLEGKISQFVSTKLELDE